MRGQSTVEFALLLPVLAGLIALTLQGGVMISDQISLQHYAEEAGLWAANNQATASTTDVQNHVYGQICGGASGPPSTTGSKYCHDTSLQVSVTRVNTPTSGVVPNPTSQVLGSSNNCKSWTLAVSPSSQTVTQNHSVSYTVTLSIGGGAGNAQSPSVALSLGGYPNGTSPGFPTFNPPTVTSSSPTSTLAFSTTSTTTPRTWTLQFGGLDQCGSGASTGLVSASLTVTGTPSPSPCGTVTVLQPSPARVPAGTATTLTIPGTGFQSGATVMFGATTSPSVTFVSSTQLTATVPATLAAGVYNVSVAVGGGCSGTFTNGITVSAAASPSPSASVSPTTIAAGYNPCAGSTGSYEMRIVITWNESLLIPWLTPGIQLTATQFSFCQ